LELFLERYNIRDEKVLSKLWLDKTHTFDPR
jgi:hypothetical protein